MSLLEGNTFKKILNMSGYTYIKTLLTCLRILFLKEMLNVCIFLSQESVTSGDPKKMEGTD